MYKYVRVNSRGIMYQTKTSSQHLETIPAQDLEHGNLRDNPPRLEAFAQTRAVCATTLFPLKNPRAGSHEMKNRLLRRLNTRSQPSSSGFKIAHLGWVLKIGMFHTSPLQTCFCGYLNLIWDKLPLLYLF